MQADAAQSLAGCHSQGIVASPASLLETKRRMKRFLSERGEGFFAWWAGFPQEKREEFIQDVYPTLVYSLEDRWCYDPNDSEQKTRKVYRKNYNRHLLLIPEFTVQYMATADNLPSLLRGWCANDALTLKATEMIVVLRSLYRVKKYPFTRAFWEEKEEQIPFKKGDIFARIVPSSMLPKPAPAPAPAPDEGAESESEQDGDSKSLSEPYARVNNPDRLVKGSGGPVNLFELGVFAYKFEFDIVVEGMVTLQHLLACLLDEYVEEILGVGDRSGVATGLMQCAVCSGSESIQKCSRCGAAWYCSKEHQRAHWPQHKDFCRQFASLSQESGGRGEAGGGET